MPSELCSGASAFKKPDQVKAANAAMKTQRHQGARGVNDFPGERNAPAYAAQPMLASPSASSTPRWTSLAALSANMISLKHADPTTNASRRRSQASNNGARLRDNSMPRDHAVAKVNKAPNRIGRT